MTHSAKELQPISLHLDAWTKELPFRRSASHMMYVVSAKGIDKLDADVFPNLEILHIGPGRTTKADIPPELIARLSVLDLRGYYGDTIEFPERLDNLVELVLPANLVPHGLPSSMPNLKRLHVTTPRMESFLDLSDINVPELEELGVHGEASLVLDASRSAASFSMLRKMNISCESLSISGDLPEVQEIFLDCQRFKWNDMTRTLSNLEFVCIKTKRPDYVDPRYPPYTHMGLRNNSIQTDGGTFTYIGDNRERSRPRDPTREISWGFFDREQSESEK